MLETQNQSQATTTIKCHCLRDDRCFTVVTEVVVWATWKTRDRHLLASHCHKIHFDLPCAFMKYP